MGYRRPSRAGLVALGLTACVHQGASEAAVIDRPAIVEPSIPEASDERWIDVVLAPLPAELGDPQLAAHEGDDCEGLAILLPDEPSVWQTVALARCLWRSDRIALALSVYEEIDGSAIEPALVRERVRARMAAHFDYGLSWSVRVAEIDALEREGLQLGVDEFLQVYADPERCANDPWQRWATLEIEIEHAGLRAATGTLLAECGGWNRSEVQPRDRERARMIITSIWPHRNEIALLSDGPERLAIARASNVLGSRALSARDALVVAEQYRLEVRSVAEDTIALVPRASPLFGDAVALSMYATTASAAPESARRVLEIAGPGGAAEAQATTRHDMLGWELLAQQGTTDRWHEELVPALAELEQLAASIDPEAAWTAVPEPLRRCVDEAECDPELVAALGERPWWFAQVRHDHRMLHELNRTLERFAGRELPERSYAELWVAFNQALVDHHTRELIVEIAEVIARRRRRLQLLLMVVDSSDPQRP